MLYSEVIDYRAVIGIALIVLAVLLPYPIVLILRLIKKWRS